MTEHGLEELRQFFGAYFHQDWMFDVQEPDQVIGQFLGDEPNPQRLVRLVNLIEEYVSIAENDVALEEALLSELWCYYSPSADGIGACDWLQHVAEVLRAGG